ncbi:TetR/AcrR family transcriptional regulator [Gallaecimonas mangrovi]|uniref:TetR/AcrR family transcriptional regulator n=1 Tax=Gallaecimonas mangrovi TaxID=2291597 RepID=UPI000E20AD45|nr:TetR/AcrR family transcriptional regulator [Gallaecimonas mangrovi]
MNTALSPKAAEIAALARSLLEQRGYNGFSYADISAQVKISKASIHHHFPSKVQLVQKVVAQYRQEARAGMATLDALEPLAALQAYVGYWANCIADQSPSFCLCAMLASELPAIPDQIAGEINGHFADLSAWLAALLDKGQQAGQLRLSASAAIEAQAFMAAVHGAMLAARATGKPEQFNDITALLLTKLVAA